MQQYYYGFNRLTRACLFSANAAPAPSDDVIVISDSEDLPVMDIELGINTDGAFFIKAREVSHEELIAGAKARKEQALLEAQGRLAILCTVNKSRNDPVVTEKISAWESYIAELYFLDISKPLLIDWPEVPELI